MTGLDLVYTPIATLKKRNINPRTHTEKQIRQIARSIEEFGFTNPILIDDDDTVIAGNGRLEAAHILNMEAVPTIQLSELTPEQVKAYIIADNKLAENAGWDEELLAIELGELSNLDLDFDITITGFEMPEIDLLIQNQNKLEEFDEEAMLADNPREEIVTKQNDLWLLGKHKLLCADATKPDSYHLLLDSEHAGMIFIDPPYNVPIDGHVSGLGAKKHREFVMASGEMGKEVFTEFLAITFKHLARHSSDGSIHFVCMDWRHLEETFVAGNQAYDELKNMCVWVKNNAGMGSLYRSQHECVLVFKSGTKPHINNVELGRHGRYRTNIWEYQGVSGFSKNRDAALEMHPTVKPVGLVADAILDCSHRRDIVLDTFGGSGTTLIAAERTGRIARLMELDPAYCDVIIRRWQKVTGNEAHHAKSGKTFNTIEEETSATNAAPELEIENV